MYCPTCGSRVSELDVKCSMCGTNIISYEKNPINVNDNKNPESPVNDFTNSGASANQTSSAANASDENKDYNPYGKKYASYSHFSDRPEKQKPNLSWIPLSIFGLIAFIVIVPIVLTVGGIVALVIWLGSLSNQYANSAYNTAPTSYYSSSGQAPTPIINQGPTQLNNLPNDLNTPNIPSGGYDPDDPDAGADGSIINPDDVTVTIEDTFSMEPNDYIVNDDCYYYYSCFPAFEGNETKAEAWLNAFYPDGQVTDYDMDSGRHYWLVTFDTPPTPIVIGPDTFEFDYIEITFENNVDDTDHYVERVVYYKNGDDVNLFDHLLNDFNGLYGNPNEKTNMNNQQILVIDAYIWHNMDAQYDLYLHRAYGDKNDDPNVAIGFYLYK